MKHVRPKGKLAEFFQACPILLPLITRPSMTRRAVTIIMTATQLARPMSVLMVIGFILQASLLVGAGGLFKRKIINE